MAVNPIIECFSTDLVTDYWDALESSTVYTAAHFWWNHLQVAHIGVYLAYRCICMQWKLFLQS
jgi:hypothetical protein